MKRILDIVIKVLTYMAVYAIGAVSGFICAIVLLNVL